MSIENFLASHPYAATTQRTYASILRTLLENQNPQELNAQTLIQLIKSQNWSNARQCLALAASQKYLAWKYGANHPALTAKIKRITGKPQRALTPQQALDLLASFDRHTPKGARDLAICALALDTGLRASELCRLQIQYIDLEHLTLQVIVKGGQWAAAIYSNQTAAHIRHWLAYRKTVNGPGWLFTSTRDGRKLSPTILHTIVKNWGKKIGITLSPHDLRRSFATLATLNGAPERILMEGGRWHNSDMIHRYTRTLKLESMRDYLPTKHLLNA